MQTILTIVAVLAVAVAGFFFWQSQSNSVSPPVIADFVGPQITRIEFPQRINSDGEYNEGILHFQSTGGIVTYAQFDVVEAGFFSPFGFEVGFLNLTEGSFEFYINSLVPQEVTLSVTLTDASGNVSPPVEFSFNVAPGAPPIGNDDGF